MRKIIFCMFLVFSLSSCAFSNMLPNKSRDEYYMTHGPSFDDLIFKINIGNTREEVLEIWGEPYKVKKDGRWVYRFEGYTSKIILTFENDVVVKYDSTIW